MKTITVGRGEGCNIVVDDEMMSRRHAIIKIPTFGGMEIVDMSKNGTFVNGVRLRPNVPFPITRKDVVNFADVHQLDWSKVPDPLKYYKIGAMVVGGLVILLLAIFLLKSLLSGSKETPAKPIIEQVEKPVQTVETEQQQESTEEKKEKETTPEENAPEATAPEGSESTAASKNDEVIDVYGAARASKRKREAEERARQQKAKEAQKAKETQKQQDSKTPSTSKPSGKNNNKTVVM